jgi:hypothetical protein
MKEAEEKMISMQLILAHIIKNNNLTKNTTLNNASFLKMRKKFMEKKEENEEELQKTLNILKDRVFPLYDSITGNLYIQIP